ncbi:MAG: hypothetical protein HY534_06675 [Chloroflexi bacterium]|nr:hypothetical protein [Chloroflexota bacterium]
MRSISAATRAEAKQWPRPGHRRGDGVPVASGEAAFLRALAGELGVSPADLLDAWLQPAQAQPQPVAGIPDRAPNADPGFHSRLVPDGWARRSADFAPGALFSLVG